MHRNKVAKKPRKNLWQRLQNYWPWFGFAAMVAISILLFFDDMKVSQKEISINIDVTNRINICEPEDGFGEEKKFFR